MSDINVKIEEPELINVQVIEAEPVNVKIVEGVSTLISNIFEPPIDGNKIVKLYVEDGKLIVKYEV